jgi:hypothetical protein
MHDHPDSILGNLESQQQNKLLLVVSYYPCTLQTANFFSLNKTLCEMKILNPTYVHIHQYQ